MKYVLAFFGVGAICLGVFLFGGQKADTEDYMRIHVVANSNSNFDQNVKYVVKDAVVEFLIPYLAGATTKQEAMKVISKNADKIQAVANSALAHEGAKYGAKVEISSENLPTRAYGDLVLEEGLYDVLKIELGNGGGDNWWCVVFPAVCFVNSSNPKNVEYISKIWEIINSGK